MTQNEVKAFWSGVAATSKGKIIANRNGGSADVSFVYEYIPAEKDETNGYRFQLTEEQLKKGIELILSITRDDVNDETHILPLKEWRYDINHQLKLDTVTGIITGVDMQQSYPGVIVPIARYSILDGYVLIAPIASIDFNIIFTLFRLA